MKYSYSHLSSPAPLPPLLTLLTKSTQLILPRYLQSHWHFNLEHLEVLERYFNANRLLLDCLKTPLKSIRNSQRENEICEIATI